MIDFVCIVIMLSGAMLLAAEFVPVKWLDRILPTGKP